MGASIMVTLTRIALILSSACAALFLSSCAAAAEQSNCELERPPRAAVADGIHGSYIFTFPWVLTPDYTGCQTTWDEHGDKVFQFEFKDGEPVQFRFAEPVPGQLTVICNYVAGHVESDSSDCPTYDRAKAVLRSHVAYEGLDVPPERDPRR
jgi:hypothetical protein